MIRPDLLAWQRITFPRFVLTGAWSRGFPAR